MPIKKEENKTNSLSNAFQELILKLTLDRINTPIHQFNQKIENDFRLIGGFLDVDHIHLFEYKQDDDNDDELKCTCEWVSQGTESQKNVYQLESLQQALFPEHHNRKSLVIQDVSSLDTTQKLYSFLTKHHIKAFYSCPIVVEKKILGFITFSELKNKRIWASDEQKLIKVLSEVIGNYLVRRSLAKQIIEFEKQARLATDAKNQFLANMSHEIRTPLSGIYNTFYLLETTPLTVEQKEYLEIGQRSTDALSNIIDDVLSLSKIELGKIEVYEDPFNIEEEMIRILRTQKEFSDEKAIQLKFKFDNRINFDLIGDYRKVNQVVSHLINNAIKYTNQGNVTLNVKLLEIDENIALIKLDVIDTGIGVDENQVNRLFDAFYQVDSSDLKKQQGIGLGLSIANQLIQILNGKLDMQSKPNQGSIVTITIPFKKGRLYDYPITQGMKSLITIDEMQNSSVKDIFESMGVEVFSFDTVNDNKCHLIIVESPVKNFDIIKDLMDKHGHENPLIISFSVPQNKRLKKIDCFFDFPVSRNSIYQKIQTQLNRETLNQETEEYNTILNGYALIVDDNRLNRIALESILNKQGIRSKTAESGFKAIEIVKNEDFDIILMDIQMPDMDGIETIRRIRNLGKKYQYIPMIAITANAFFKDYDMMKTARINDVIFKPIRLEQLNQMLRKYIRTGTSIDIPDELLVFDEKDFKQRFEGSEDIATEVIQSFLETYKKDMQDIKTSILKVLPDEIMNTCHYIKGSCAYLSGKRTVWILDYIMDAAKNHKMEFMNLCYEMLDAEINELVKVIKKYKI